MSKIKKRTKISEGSPFKNYWNKINYLFIAAGLLLVIVGFIVMGQGTWDNPVSLSLSPIILLTAYLIVFPLAILYKKKKKTEENSIDGTSKN